VFLSVLRATANGALWGTPPTLAGGADARGERGKEMGSVHTGVPVVLHKKGRRASCAKEPAHLASRRPFTTRATVSGSCQCAAASASTVGAAHARCVHGAG
jgi:hypothetical protein